MCKLRCSRLTWRFARSLLGQQLGMSTLRVVSQAGRLTKPEHVFVIVRNLVDSRAADAVGRVRMLPPDASGMQVGPELSRLLGSQSTFSPLASWKLRLHAHMLAACLSGS